MTPRDSRGFAFTDFLMAMILASLLFAAVSAVGRDLQGTRKAPGQELGAEPRREGTQPGAAAGQR
ncbi:MAG: hypothetical protein FGM27_01025 [Candidatus Omnitrophica bacterium]|nr:hypothetical protein [Candidatus Omnitrophota bacterium]